MFKLTAIVKVQIDYAGEWFFAGHEEAMLDCIQLVVVAILDADLEHLVGADELSAVAVNIGVHLHHMFNEVPVIAELLCLHYP